MGEFMDMGRKYNNKFLEDVDSVKKVYEELIEKTINSRLSEEYRDYREQNTVRGGRFKSSNLAFRGTIDHLSSKTDNNNKRKEIPKQVTKIVQRRQSQRRKLENKIRKYDYYMKNILNLNKIEQNK